MWTAKTLFTKLNSFIKPDLRVELTDAEDKRISNIRLFTADCKHLFNLCADEDAIRTIANVLENLSSEDFTIKTHLCGLLYGNSGYLYELLTYDWLMKRDIYFAPQVKVASEDILSNKSSGTALDGIFMNGSIYFDIKSFEIPVNINEAIINKLSTSFSNFNIMLEGNLDSDYSELARLTLEKTIEIEKAVKEAFSSDNDSDCKECIAWSYPITELGVSIRFEQKDVNGGIHMAIGEFDPYGWAKNNEVFFLKNVEQYATKRPFILICPYKNLPLYKEDIKIGLRSIARRAFVKLHNISKSDPNYDRYNKEAHRKIDNSVSIAEIASYLSGILFIDISKRPIVENGFFFANPNAVKRLDYFHLEQIFNYEIQKMPYYDNFSNDNY